MDHKSKTKFVVKSIDLWRQGGVTLILPLAICSAKQTKDFFIWTLLVQIGLISELEQNEQEFLPF